MSAEVLRARLRERFEIGRHPLSFRSEELAAPGRLRLRFADAAGRPVRGWLLLPGGPGPHPLLIVVHAHGNRHDLGALELLEGRPALAGPLGPALVARGLAAACLDLPCFGERSGEAESAAAKAALWRGGSLAGRMLGELASQIDHFAADPRIDAARIGLFGLSMGATLGGWLSAVDLRVAALAQLCCLADIEELIAAGAHDLHGIYLIVPGLPGLARNGVIAGLVAPRPQLVCAGARDPLTPPEALGRALTDLRNGYASAPEALEVILDPEGGHAESPAMRAAVLRFLGRHLGA
jgi:hypothetical protein